MNTEDQLRATIARLVEPGKGILAADESIPTIAKRFEALGIALTEENRRAYRALLFTTPRAADFLAGVILFEESLGHRSDDGVLFPDLLQGLGILPGIKVDRGTVPLHNASGDLITQGLDGLDERLESYKVRGARFAKWREVYRITADNPTPLGIAANAEVLARYAAICQAHGIVPIVEPEVLLDGDHSLERCREVSAAVLHAVFAALYRHRVLLDGIVLKPSMVLPGKACADQAGPDVVAAATLAVLRRTVPAAVPTINFLSGGQTPEQATANLNAMNVQDPQAPWVLSFSYSRALQDPVLRAWGGHPENVVAAQQSFARRLELNSLARDGKYRAGMEPS